MNETQNRWYTWLFLDPRYVYLCLAVLALSATIVLFIDSHERTIRLVGLSLQLAGISTVVWGITETARFFGLMTPLDSLRAWLRRRPKRRRVTVVQVGTASESDEAFALRANKSVSIDTNTLPLYQLEALARSVAILSEQVRGLEREFDAANRDHRVDLARHDRTVSQSLTDLYGHVKRLGTGGLHISTIGAAWMFAGSALSTASQEIAWLLR